MDVLVLYLNTVTDNLLMPLFTPEKICNLADDMMDIMSQLVLKWERSVVSNHTMHIVVAQSA